MRKLKPRDVWEGREAEWVWKIHRADITRLSNARAGKGCCRVRFYWQWDYLDYGPRG